MTGALAAFTPFRAVSATPQNRPRIALIIDDVGYSIPRVNRFLALNLPLTFSILPRLAFSSRLAVTIAEHGHELMLHQPMEPHNAAIDPGPGAVYMKNSRRQIERTIEDNIALTPLVSGVNNHMGSLFTESGDRMRQVLGLLKKRNLFFIDSYTTSDSQAYLTARRLGMRAGFRNVFLDNSPKKSDILVQLDKVKKYARRSGCAVAIGHPLTETATALREFLGSHRDQFEFVYASHTVGTGG